MDQLYGRLNLGLNLDLDIEAQQKTTTHGTNNLYKLKVATKI